MMGNIEADSSVDEGMRGPRVTTWIDYVCPYSYLAEKMLRRLEREAGLTVEYRPFELRPAPAPMLDASDARLRAAWIQAIEPLAERLDVEIAYPPVQPRTRKAHEAAAFAREHGRFRAMHDALYRAFFVEGRDIGRIDVLLDIAASEPVGLERTALKVALDIDQFTVGVVDAQREALDAGIDGTPSYEAGGEIVSGLQSYGALRELVLGRRAGGTATDADGDRTNESGGG